MFRWYRRSEVCYAYLEDVSQSDLAKPGVPGPAFCNSRWFRRGWTLQELLAPRRVHFYDNGWNAIGEKSALCPQLESITGIDESTLTGGSLREVSIGQRMSWASHRETTRIEDIAYSLLGIFGVNMPLLYGEGQNAFLRLQEEIMKRWDDHSLFAWRATPESARHQLSRGILASSPREFANFRKKSSGMFEGKEFAGEDQIMPFGNYHGSQNPATLTNRGVRLTSVIEDMQPDKPLQFIALGLNCMNDNDISKTIGIYLQRLGGDTYVRVRPHELATCRSYGPQKTIYGLSTWPPIWDGDVPNVPRQSPALDMHSRPVDMNLTPADMASLDPDQEDANGLRMLYQYAFYLHTTSIRIDAQGHSYYRVSGTYLSETPGVMRYNRLDSRSQGQPVIIPTRRELRYRPFKGGIFLKGSQGLDSILLVLGTSWDPQALDYSCWFETIQLGDQPGIPDPETLIWITSATPPPLRPFDHKLVTTRDRSVVLNISVKLQRVLALDMFCIEINGNAAYTPEAPVQFRL